MGVVAMNVAITNCSKCDWVSRADASDLRCLVAMSEAADAHELAEHPEGAMFGFKVIEDAVYYHIGTGVTESTEYCPVCEGFYGVPHDFDHSTHPHCSHCASQCACRPCQESTGVYPSEGEFRRATPVS